eukprot:2936427-Prorocentrum_lima.AAC.1
MTSSLVGSEMCIRDRVEPQVVVDAVVLLEVVVDYILDLHRLPQQMPVSYTHLTLPTICSV